jgi:cytochrome c oxidase assembly protein subunit 15
LFFLVGGFALRLLLREREPLLRRVGAVLLVVLLAQLTLGISTLLSHVAVPVAAAHQGGAIALLTVLLVTVYGLRRPAP